MWECLLSLLSYITQDHQIRDGTTQNEPDPFTSTINQKYPLHACLRQFDVGTFWIEFPSPKMSGFCQVHIKQETLHHTCIIIKNKKWEKDNCGYKRYFLMFEDITICIATIFSFLRHINLLATNERNCRLKIYPRIR